MTKNWKEVLVQAGFSIREGLARLSATGQQILLVVDDQDRLIGTITDGDIRRGLLKGLSLDGSVDKVMCSKPQVLEPGAAPSAALELMRSAQVNALPVAEPNGRVVGLVRRDDLVTTQPERPNWVVILAGGLGQRLRPLTESVPKPMLLIGGRPILETLIAELHAHGLRKIFLSINYKAEVIRRHFGDGSRFGVEIVYLEESSPLGTAGPLGLLGEVPKAPLLVINGDLLTKVDFSHLLDYHSIHAASATVCVRPYDMQVPFGVVEFEESLIRGIVEKPVQSFMVSAGIYAIEPWVTTKVPNGQSKDMPALIAELIDEEKTVVGFPIHEYWIDIGRHSEFSRANHEYERIFT